jgi:translocation protein SEC66
MFDIDWKGLALPFAYLLVLGGALMTFSTIYRRRKAGTALAPFLSLLSRVSLRRKKC